jgi:hypothetical protein
VDLPILVHLAALAVRPRGFPISVGIEAIRINIVLPCRFSAAVGTSQASGRFRIDPHADAELRAMRKSAAVQRDRWCAATQSVSRAAIEVSRTLGGCVRPSHVMHRNQVDIALLMAERHRFSDDYNDCLRCSTCF